MIFSKVTFFGIFGVFSYYSTQLVQARLSISPGTLGGARIIRSNGLQILFHNKLRANFNIQEAIDFTALMLETNAGTHCAKTLD